MNEQDLHMLECELQTLRERVRVEEVVAMDVKLEEVKSVVDKRPTPEERRQSTLKDIMERISHKPEDKG